MAHGNTEPDGDIKTDRYVVGLLDLLNQGNQLKRWSRLPKSPEEETKFNDALGKTVRVVEYFRSCFEAAFSDNFGPQEADDPCFSSLSEEERAEYRRLNSVPLGRQYFSDTTVLYSPLAILGGDVTVQGLHGMLCASANMMIAGLAGGVGLRGGIEVGLGTEHFAGEIYGPVLRLAHRLESEVAGFPRVVVGMECMRFLQECLDSRDITKAARMNRGYARISGGLIDQDHEGRYFVDYLGRGYRDSLREKSQMPELIRRAYQFVRKEHRRFVSEGDEKLAFRYEQLEQYFKSKIWLWE